MPLAQLSIKPCGSVTLTRLRPTGFNCVSTPPTPPQQCDDGQSKGLSVKLNDATPAPPSLRACRGSKGLTGVAKSKLVFAVSYLEKKYGKRPLTFWTATVPTNDPSKLREILEKNKEILKYLRDQLSKYLASLGLPTEVILVAELQKRGALHFHAVFVGRLHTAKIDRRQLDQLWERVLRAKVTLPAELSFRASCRAEPIKKSVGRYLAKYLSKSVSKENDITKSISITWYSIGSELTRLYHDLLEQGKFCFDCSNTLFSYLVSYFGKILICGKVINRSDLLIGVKGFAETRERLTYLLLSNPVCYPVFCAFLLPESIT